MDVIRQPDMAAAARVESSLWPQEKIKYAMIANGSLDGQWSPPGEQPKAGVAVLTSHRVIFAGTSWPDLIHLDFVDCVGCGDVSGGTLHMTSEHHGLQLEGDHKELQKFQSALMDAVPAFGKFIP